MPRRGSLRMVCRVKYRFSTRVGALLAAMVFNAAATPEPGDGTSPVDAPVDTETTPTNPLARTSLFELDPQPVIPRPLTPEEYERERLAAIQEVEEEEFTAPPFLVSRISTLPVMRGDSSTQAVYRAERNMLRERARVADRMFRRGDPAGALALVGETERLLKSPALRAMALNRLAAYHFRLRQYDQTAVYARRAWELEPGDLVSACNLAAVLLTVGEVDEALDILLRIYGQVFTRPQLAFSVHFNLACAYSLKEDGTKAVQNLFLAAQIDPVATFAAIGDTQLDFIRDNPEFIRLRNALAEMIQRAERKP